MVAVFNKELLSWYLITLKLRETLESRIQPLSPASEWVISIKEKLEQARQDNVPCSWAKLSIYKIPRYLRDSGGDGKAFAPQIVSLGPYHHGKRHLRQMERHKWRSVNHVLKRTKHDIRLYLNAMKEMEERARSCYEGPISLSSNEFVEMLVLDGCFVIELFRGATVGFEELGYSSNDPVFVMRGSMNSIGTTKGFKELGYSRNDPVFAMRGSMHSILRDMLKLENQLPLFVLDRLLGIQLGKPDLKGLVAGLALRFFDPLMPTDESLTKSDRNKRRQHRNIVTAITTFEFDPLSDQRGLHCLDVFRRNLLRIKGRSHPHRFADKRRQQLIHCVTKLREAGIKFKKRKTDRFWDIEFKDGILWIPRLLIHDGTKSLLLNLIAFEQCYLGCSNHITSYVIFMDNLIDSPEDVGYLHYCGIIEHWLGSDDDVANLFNRLCQEVAFSINDSYLFRLSGDVNRYCSHRWNTWCASLRHNYFNNPWAIISLVAAAVLLLLTFAQTYYSIYGYYRPAQ